jgi:hypothetical protein
MKHLNASRSCSCEEVDRVLFSPALHLLTSLHTSWPAKAQLTKC